MLLETLYYEVSPRQLVCFRGTFVAYRKSDPKFSSLEYAINRFFFLASREGRLWLRLYRAPYALLDIIVMKGSLLLLRACFISRGSVLACLLAYKIAT